MKKEHWPNYFHGETTLLISRISQKKKINLGLKIALPETTIGANTLDPGMIKRIDNFA